MQFYPTLEPLKNSLCKNAWILFFLDDFLWLRLKGKKKVLYNNRCIKRISGFEPGGIELHLGP